MFALASCGGGEIGEFTAVVNNSSPTKITTHTYILSDNGEELNGSFVTEINENGSTLYYEYERNAIPGVDSSPTPVMTVKGTVYYKDGKYSTDGKSWSADAPDVTAFSFKLDLNKENLGEYELKRNTLSTTLTVENAEKVLGIKLGNVADDSISFKVKTNGSYLTGVEISYTSTTGESVYIDTSYTYTPAQVEAEE
jgi:hypothetical protein